MELSKAETVYLAMAIRSMLEKDLCKADREAYEKLFLKVRISHNGKKIQEIFRGGEHGKIVAQAYTE